MITLISKYSCRGKSLFYVNHDGRRLHMTPQRFYWIERNGPVPEGHIVVVKGSLYADDGSVNYHNISVVAEKSKKNVAKCNICPVCGTKCVRTYCGKSCAKKADWKNRGE